MKIIEPNAIELKQTDLFKHIELCGRTCYKSEDKITDSSSEKFVNMLKSHAHGAMLEHGTVYLTIPHYNQRDSKGKILENEYQILINNKYTQRNINYNIQDSPTYITTNYRVIVENTLEDLLLKYQSECTEYHVKRRTFKITCNRGVSHEFVRHRVFSFAQESQRYCNYGKNKFDNEIKIIKPIYFDNNSLQYAAWYNSCSNAEESYLRLLNLGATPQEAREVLPNATATELIMTGFESDWEHFFTLRCAKDAHPQAQEIANKIKEIF